MDNYINAIIEFKYNGKVHNALVFQITEDEKLCCYRLVRKTKESKQYFPLIKANGSSSEFQIFYGCRFILPSTIKKRILFYSHPSSLKEAERRYKELPSMTDLAAELKRLKEELKIATPEETKSIQAKISSLTMTINGRGTAFLRDGKRKKESKYSNYRLVPNNAGIRKLPGGRTSPK